MKREICTIGLVALAVLTGCQKVEPDDPRDPSTDPDKDDITFVIEQSGSWKNTATKAGEDVILTTEDGEEMVLNSFVYDGIETTMAPDTKGTPISAGNIDLYSSELRVNALWDGSSFIDDYLSRNGENWAAAKGTYYWPVSDAYIDFWAWAPAKTEYGEGTFRIPTINDGVMRFTYKLEKHERVSDTADYFDDAKHQPDLLYVRSLQHSKGDSKSSVIKFEFQHALAAVKFKIRTNSEGSVKSVSLLNVSSEGDCVYTPASSNASGSFVWTSKGAPLAGTADTEYTQSFYAETLSAGESRVVTDDEDGTVFMMIPQNLGIQKIRIVYHENKFNRDMVFTGTIPGSSWAAGKTYLYTIDYRTFSISVSDKVTGMVKSDLVIRNTGSTPAFIRAAIVGYWARTDKNGKEMIVAPWDKSKGTFVGLAGKNWFKEGEYYYYKNPVPGSTAVTDALFTSYTYTGEAPVAGATLHIRVSAQAVEYDSAKAHVTDAWGAGIAANMNAD